MVRANVHGVHTWQMVTLIHQRHYGIVRQTGLERVADHLLPKGVACMR